MSGAVEIVGQPTLRRNDHWVRSWPLSRSTLVPLATNVALLLAVTSSVGLLFMWYLDQGPVGDADRAVAEWLEDHRTENLNTLTHYGSMLSDTLVKVTLVVLAGGAAILIWRRWHDGVFIALAVIVESTVFVLASLIVGRDRPPVEQLDPPAPSGSFPSGHAAAAVAFYGAVFIVACWHTRSRLVRVIFFIVAVEEKTLSRTDSLVHVMTGQGRVCAGRELEGRTVLHRHSTPPADDDQSLVRRVPVPRDSAA